MAQFHPPRLVALDTLRTNEKNPRSIDPARFDKLVESLLDFPEMLAARPAVIDELGVILGGNMRTAAKRWLVERSELEKTEHKQRALDRRHKQRERDGEAYSADEEFAYRRELEALLYDETALVSIAEGLTARQKQEFIIKDNASFGSWDWDKLAGEDWGGADFEGWGIDTDDDGWKANKPRKAKKEKAPKTAGAGSDDGPANRAPEPVRPKNELVITFNNPDDVQLAEPEFIELLDRIFGPESYTLKARVAFE